VAQYEFYHASLLEALEQFNNLTTGLNAAYDQLNEVLAQWQDSLPELRRQLAFTADNVVSAADGARRAGQALENIAEAYAKAERQVYDGVNVSSQQTALLTSPPHISKPNGKVLFTDTVMPNWLQIAVIKYEQAQLVV